MNLRLRLAMEWLAIGLFATAVVVATLFWRGTAGFDNLLYDQLTAVNRPAAGDQVLLITIDDPSLAALGQWPWDRAIHARLIEKLQSRNPRSITLDILLSEKASALSDEQLSSAMTSRAAPVFVPLHFSSPGSDGRAYDTVLPTSVYAGAASGIGHANILFDDDGIVRRTTSCFRADESSPAWPHLMDLVYRGKAGVPSPTSKADAKCSTGLLIPYSRRGAFAEISYADILAGDIPEEMVRGKDIIIGATATGMGDNFPTPNGEGGLLSGIEIMANMLGAIRRNDFIQSLQKPWVIGLSLLPSWLLLLGFLRWRPRTVLIMSLVSLVAILAISAGLLWKHIWFPPGSALLGVLLVYPLWGWRRLQAMSDFMRSELTALEQEGEVSPLPVRQNRTTDMVGRQSEALAIAIDHMRDLRRFVADTLADLPDPMFVTDPTGKVTLTNDLLTERLGRDISGIPLTEALDLMVLDEQRALVDSYLQKSGDTPTSAEFVRFVSKQGLTFVMRRSEVRSQSGALHGHIHYLTDITDLAQAEAEREQVLQLLSHDMRAPQSTIIALLDREIDEDAKKRIERNARRTMQLAQDFVEIARMGETEFVGEDVLLADLVREAADSLWPLAQERGIKFAFGDSSNAAFVMAEPDSLQRAVCNLIDNAIKFSPDNGLVGIAVSRDAGEKIVITISDQGEGIAPDVLPNLFRRFVASGEQTGRVKGVGLGLTFVQAVIERHRGTVQARNNAEGGAAFVITLPEAPES
jgi:PAS domain S-box-containing protein